MIRKNRGFESHPLRHIDTNQKQNNNLINEFKFAHLENYSRGRRGAPAKGVGWVTAARVQIPHSPPGKGQSKDCPFRIFTSFKMRDLNPTGTNQALKNNRRILRRHKCPLVCLLFSLRPPSFLRHWRRSAPSPILRQEKDNRKIVLFAYLRPLNVYIK